MNEEEEQSPYYKAFKGSIGKDGKSFKEQRPSALSKSTEKDEESENFEKVSVDDTPKQVKSLPQLVKLDVNMDTLKNFLEDI